jgi:hypothetical protein
MFRQQDWKREIKHLWKTKYPKEKGPKSTQFDIAGKFSLSCGVQESRSSFEILRFMRFWFNTPTSRFDLGFINSRVDTQRLINPLRRRGSGSDDQYFGLGAAFVGHYPSLCVSIPVAN